MGKHRARTLIKPPDIRFLTQGFVSSTRRELPKRHGCRYWSRSSSSGARRSRCRLRNGRQHRGAGFADECLRGFGNDALLGAYW